MVRPRQRPRDRVDRDSVTDPSPGWDHHTLARGPLCRSMIFLSSLSLKIVIDVGHPPPVILFLFCFCIGATLGGGIHLLPLLSFLLCPIGLGHCQTRGNQTLSTVHRWLATKIPAVAGGGRRRRHPRPSNSLLHPWKCYLRTPSLARLDVYLSWAIALPGRQIPAPTAPVSLSLGAGEARCNRWLVGRIFWK